MTEQVTRTDSEHRDNTAQIIGSVLNVVFTAVIPAVIRLIEELKKQNFTVEDIERLKAIVKRPEDFFDKPQGG
jgi:hypothetical protein